MMSDAVYGEQTSWKFYRTPVLWPLLFVVAALFVAVPKEWARRMVWKHGRRPQRPGAGYDGGNEKLAGAR